MNGFQGRKMSEYVLILDVIQFYGILRGNMNKSTEQIILGSMFGDGGIYYGGNRYITPHYNESHSLKQKKYVKWKAILLKELKPKIYERSQFDKRFNKTYKNITIETNTNYELIKFRKLFYNGRKGNKIIRLSALKLLKLLGLAIWYMDDGTYNYRDRTIKLHSSMDNLFSQKNIKQYFTSLGMKCSIYKVTNKDNWFVGFDVESSDKFLKLIYKFIPDCMLYKLGHLCNDNKIKLEKLRKKRLITLKKYQITNRKAILLQRKNHYVEHRKEILLNKKEYEHKNPERVKQWSRISYIRNRDKILAYAKKYRKENHEKICKYDRMRYVKRKKYVRVKSKKYYLEHCEEIKSKNRERYAKNKNK